MRTQNLNLNPNPNPQKSGVGPDGAEKFLKELGPPNEGGLLDIQIKTIHEV